MSKPNIEELRKKLDVEGLIKALGHSDWHVRRDAASALVKIRDEKAVKPLLKKAVKPLIKALKDENAEGLPIKDCYNLLFPASSTALA